MSRWVGDGGWVVGWWQLTLIYALGKKGLSFMAFQGPLGAF